MATATCNVCFRACLLEEGQTGVCFARGNAGGKIVPLNYGLLTSLSLDPIEKKPLNRFMPGKNVLSVGTFGCNLKCAFCQNCEISQAKLMSSSSMPDSLFPAPGETFRVQFSSPDGMTYRIPVDAYTPDELLHLALSHRTKNNIGMAFTYNEPLVGFEFVRDTARLIREAGMKNVLVTAGCVSMQVLEEVLPYIDAMNIDLKSFRPAFYEMICKGNLPMVKAFIETAAAHCHVELTTLVIPGENDSEAEIREIAGWIASLNGGTGTEIPYHISRFFPRYRMNDRRPTDVEHIYRLADVAREKLKYVYTGNC